MRSTLQRIMAACLTLSCIPLAILVVITAADVVARYALASSVPDTIEISGLMLGLLISFGLAPITYGDRQVRIEIIESILPRGPRMVIFVTMQLIGAVVFALMGWQAIIRSLKSYSIGEFAGYNQIPIWPAKFLFAIGTLLTFIAFVAIAVRAIRAKRTATPDQKMDV